MNKYVLKEIMQLPIKQNNNLLHTLRILKKYVEVNLIMDKNNNICYEVDIYDLLLSDIKNEELIEVRENGWQLAENEKKIQKQIKWQ